MSVRDVRGLMPVSVATKDCPRCGVPIHAPDAPHLCADKVARMKRQAQWVDAVVAILADHGYGDVFVDDLEADRRAAAEDIVKRLRNMGVEHE